MNKKNNSEEGIGCTILTEPIPSYNVAEAENVIQGKNNTFIVLGRDRPSNKLSGYGGKGSKGAGSIDIVAGRTSAIIKEEKNGEKVLTDPSMQFDAARVLVSQKTDVDDNFHLPDGSIGNIKETSTVAIKSDNTRIIAREGIKLVTNSDKYDSHGDLKIRTYGVDMLATNGEHLQPIPKGDNLVEVLNDIYLRISQLSSEIANNYRLLLTISQGLSFHTHPTAMGPTAPSVELIPIIAQTSMDAGLHIVELQKLQLLLEKAKLKYLNNGTSSYINSLYHKVD